MDANYEFRLPEELIAHEPADPRDSARLFIYSTKTNEVMFDTFSNIARYHPSDTLMIFNDTKVVPSRLELTKITGGKVRILFLFNEWKRGNTISGLSDRELNPGDLLFYNHQKIVQVVENKNGEFIFLILPEIDEFLRISDTYGRMPLPPYIDTRLGDEIVRTKYQSIFAKNPASVAAPTASLHFTEEVFKSLDQKGIEREFVTLHVGRGTFSPVTEENFKNNVLHREPILIQKEVAQRIQAAKNTNRNVAAVGTTALRLLEGAAETILKGEGFEGETDIFITHPYKFQIANILVTNFHLPKTSLLMLVDAFLRDKKSVRQIGDLYEIAIKEKFRFYSFGDGMLIL